MCDNCPDDAVDIEEFTFLVQGCVNDFKEHWLKNNKENPEHYPLTMNEGDFWEQLLAFIGFFGGQ